MTGKAPFAPYLTSTPCAMLCISWSFFFPNCTIYIYIYKKNLEVPLWFTAILLFYQFLRCYIEFSNKFKCKQQNCKHYDDPGSFTPSQPYKSLEVCSSLLLQIIPANLAEIKSTSILEEYIGRTGNKQQECLATAEHLPRTNSIFFNWSSKHRNTYTYNTKQSL